MVEIVDVVIRNANDQDLEAMEWEGEYRRYRRVYKMALDEARLGRRIVLVAETGGRLIGQILVQLGRAESDGTGYLYAFRVRPAWRNQGIGTRLIQEAEACLVRLGCHRAMIAVAKDNPSARRLYERTGYSHYADDPGEWSFTDDIGRLQHIVEPSWLMERLLST